MSAVKDSQGIHQTIRYLPDVYYEWERYFEQNVKANSAYALQTTLTKNQINNSPDLLQKHFDLGFVNVSVHTNPNTQRDIHLFMRAPTEARSEGVMPNPLALETVQEEGPSAIDLMKGRYKSIFYHSGQCCGVSTVKVLKAPTAYNYNNYGANFYAIYMGMEMAYKKPGMAYEVTVTGNGQETQGCIAALSFLTGGKQASFSFTCPTDGKKYTTYVYSSSLDLTKILKKKEENPVEEVSSIKTRRNSLGQFA